MNARKLSDWLQLKQLPYLEKASWLFVVGFLGFSFLNPEAFAGFGFGMLGSAAKALEPLQATGLLIELT